MGRAATVGLDLIGVVAEPVFCAVGFDRLEPSPARELEQARGAAGLGLGIRVEAAFDAGLMEKIGKIDTGPGGGRLNRLRDPLWQAGSLRRLEGRSGQALLVRNRSQSLPFKDITMASEKSKQKACQIGRPGQKEALPTPYPCLFSFT